MIKLIILLFSFQIFMIYCYQLINKNQQLNEKKCNESFYYWKINNHAKDAYIFGTIHIPYIKLWKKLPNFLENQLIKSDIIYFELDLLNENIKSKLIDCQLIPNNKHLKHYLNDEQLYRKIKLFFKDKRKEVDDKVYFDLLTRNWRFKKLIWILFLVNFLIDNDSQFFRIQSLDNLISLKARQLNKRIKSIETVDDQCRPLNNLNLKNVIKLLNFTLNNYFNNNLSSSLNQLVDQYRCGDLNNNSQFNFLGQNNQFKNNNEKQEIESINLINLNFQKQLIEQRNEKISELINLELKKNKDKNLLFIIGSAHFLGTNSNNVLIKLMNKFNYQIEKVNKINLINSMNDHHSLSSNFKFPINLWREYLILNNLMSNHSINRLNSIRTDAIRKSYYDFWIYFKLLN